MLLRWMLKKLGPEKMAEEIVQVACGSVYKVFIDKDFRKQLNFERQSRIEQDRFFNELVVTALILVYYISETAVADKQGDDACFWRSVRDLLKTNFLAWLGQLGIDKKFVDTWGRLIELRTEEYNGDKIEMRRQMTESKEFQDQVLNVRFIRVQVLAIGCLRHLRRGKETPKDPLYKYLLSWLTDLNKKIEKLT